MNGAPGTVGVRELGDTVQVGGAPPPQLRFTRLLYPLTAFSVPLNVPDWLTFADNGVLLIVIT